MKTSQCQLLECMNIIQYPICEADGQELGQTVAGHVLEYTVWRHKSRSSLPKSNSTFDRFYDLKFDKVEKSVE